MEAQWSSTWPRSATSQGPGPHWLPPQTEEGSQPATSHGHPILVYSLRSQTLPWTPTRPPLPQPLLSSYPRPQASAHRPQLRLAPTLRGQRPQPPVCWTQSGSLGARAAHTDRVECDETLGGDSRTLLKNEHQHEHSLENLGGRSEATVVTGMCCFLRADTRVLSASSQRTPQHPRGLGGSIIPCAQSPQLRRSGHQPGPPSLQVAGAGRVRTSCSSSQGSGSAHQEGATGEAGMKPRPCSLKGNPARQRPGDIFKGRGLAGLQPPRCVLCWACGLCPQAPGTQASLQSPSLLLQHVRGKAAVRMEKAAVCEQCELVTYSE